MSASRITIRVPFAVPRASALPLLLLVLLAGAAGAQQPVKPIDSAGVARDSAALYAIQLRDGSTIVGRVANPAGDPLVVQTSHGTLRIPQGQVAELTPLTRSNSSRGEYWPPSPNETRLLFAPTGRMLEKGEGYFSNTYLFFQHIAGGVTNRFTMGGGLSLFPLEDPGNNIIYITPKVGLYGSERVNVALGVLAGLAPAFDSNDGRTDFGIAYGVATLGPPDAHVTVGTGFGFASGEFSDTPIGMLGGEVRLSRRAALVTENYFLPAGFSDGALVSYGVRFFGGKLSADLAFWNLVGSQETVFFPGIPYVSFAFKW